MNDQDYILKGIELADGFRHSSGIGYCDIIESDGRTICGGIIRRQLPSWFKDALAAQLVRQVDALPSTIICNDFDLTVYCEHADFWVQTARPRRSEIYGSDRAMNTIKIIVDSKTLEKP